ncbi:MAG: Prophage CP4-57 integrase [Chromatiales bacterium USCg_Taylor]|nr:MAG: Prophage CP4-57 integrase [Chromatiales bacterium USCg_Taylor]
MLPDTRCNWRRWYSCALANYARRNGPSSICKAEWRIPAHKMKMKAVHIVPLSIQALAILTELHALTGSGRYVFPGARTGLRQNGIGITDFERRQLQTLRIKPASHSINYSNQGT